MTHAASAATAAPACQALSLPTSAESAKPGNHPTGGLGGIAPVLCTSDFFSDFYSKSLRRGWGGLVGTHPGGGSKPNARAISSCLPTNGVTSGGRSGCSIQRMFRISSSTSRLLAQTLRRERFQVSRTAHERIRPTNRTSWRPSVIDWVSRVMRLEVSPVPQGALAMRFPGTPRPPAPPQASIPPER